MRAQKHLREQLAALREAGLDVLRVEYGGTHPRAVVALPHGERRVSLATSPSRQTTLRNTRAYARRLAREHSEEAAA